MCYRTRKYTVCRHVRAALSPENFIGWGSERVNLLARATFREQGSLTPRCTCQASRNGRCWYQRERGYRKGVYTIHAISIYEFKGVYTVYAKSIYEFKGVYTVYAK